MTKVAWSVGFRQTVEDITDVQMKHSFLVLLQTTHTILKDINSKYRNSKKEKRNPILVKYIINKGTA